MSSKEMDFWTIQSQRLKEAGYNEKIIDNEMRRYRLHSLNESVWPEGEAFYQKILLNVFNTLIEDKQRI